MGLEKLTIQIESPGSTDSNLQFGGREIVALFNPSRLTVSRSVSWPSQSAKRDTPESHFIGGEPAMLSVDLLFDTYDTPELRKDSVKEKYTDKLLQLTTVAGHGEMHRPPVCRLRWGEMAVFFQGVLQQIETQFTLFLANGTPVRATNRCSFKEWTSNLADSEKQRLMSADVAKVWVVRHGDTLATIAAAEYGNPRQWQLIAEANALDDPLRLEPGMQLLLPPRRPGWNPQLPP